MTKTLRVALGLLLCLVLCVCLLPAAWADGQGAETFAALKQAIANGDTYFNMDNCGTVVFTEDITIPSTMHLEAYGTSVIIPEGVTLTVDGTAQFSHVTVQSGGHVTVNKYFGAYSMLAYESVDQFTVNGEFEVFEASWTDELKNLSLGEKADFELGINAKNEDALIAALARDYHFPNKKFTKNVTVLFDWILSQDYTISDVHIDIGFGGSLTIPEGKTLINSDTLRAQDGPIYLQGTLINYGQFFIHPDKSTGALLIRSGNGSYYGGDIVVHADMDKRDACLEGFGTSLYKRYVGEWGTSYVVGNSGIFTALKQAIANGETNFNMNNRGTLLITEDVTIPANMRLTAKENCAVVVAGGATLTVDGQCGIRLFDVLDGGHVTVSEGAYFGVSNVLTYVRVDQFTVNGSFEVFEPAWTDELKNLSLGEKADFELGITAKNEDALIAALARDYHFPNKKFIKNVSVLFDWILSQDYEIRDVHIDIGGSLTIPEGKTLINSDTLRAQDAPIYLQGTLINYGQFFILPDKSSGALLIRSGNGYYGGRELVVHADMGKRDACLSGFDLSKFDTYVGPWGTSYSPPKDMVLPGSLQTLEAEAFTGGSFRSVLIPPSIRSIAPTAFGDMAGLVIYGASGTAAERFAADHGHYFVNMQ